MQIEQSVDMREIYLLKQDSNELHIFDFEARKFAKKVLSRKIPLKAKSVQLHNGNIFVVGGLSRNEQSKENQVVRDCFKIDTNY